jgi:hypothetical protein
MDYRYLGRSGFRVPALSLGTATFGGKGDFFAAWGDTGAEQATRLVDMCLDFGLNMFDSADIYSAGLAEEILGAAINGKRDRVIISTKATFRSGDGPNDVGSSRYHLINACEKALKRLRTDYIDIFQLHGFDARTPIEETLSALDDLVRAGKIRYVGCSKGGICGEKSIPYPIEVPESTSGAGFDQHLDYLEIRGVGGEVKRAGIVAVRPQKFPPRRQSSRDAHRGAGQARPLGHSLQHQGWP